jgi:protein-disulfide isomerase
MNERKSFFESLEPKSAMLVGLVAGFMGLCTIGFFILGGIMLKGDRFVVKEKKSGSVVQNDNVAMPSNPTPSAGPVSFTITDKDHSFGSKNAKVTLVTFSDFECPYCGRFYPTVKEIMKQYGDKVRVVFKHFPLSFHKNAQKAAEASECAAEQGKFWQMHDKIFENQQLLSFDQLKAWAKDLKLNISQFNSCLDSGKFAQKVQADMQEGAQKGVDGTPATFVNGILVSGAQPFEAFKQMIDQELAR